MSAIALAALAAFVAPLARHAPATAHSADLTQVANNDGCPQAARERDAASHPGASEISWFQGTLEEAFAGHSRSHSRHRPTALLNF
jgi:hypothetical protein